MKESGANSGPDGISPPVSHLYGSRIGIILILRGGSFPLCRDGDHTISNIMWQKSKKMDL